MAVLRKDIFGFKFELFNANVTKHPSSPNRIRISKCFSFCVKEPEIKRVETQEFPFFSRKALKNGGCAIVLWAYFMAGKTISAIDNPTFPVLQYPQTFLHRICSTPKRHMIEFSRIVSQNEVVAWSSKTHSESFKPQTNRRFHEVERQSLANKAVVLNVAAQQKVYNKKIVDSPWKRRGKCSCTRLYHSGFCALTRLKSGPIWKGAHNCSSGAELWVRMRVNRKGRNLLLNGIWKGGIISSHGSSTRKM